MTLPDDVNFIVSLFHDGPHILVDFTRVFGKIMRQRTLIPLLPHFCPINEEQAMEEYGILPSCPIAPYGPFMRLKNEKLLTAKAFDNRVDVGHKNSLS